MAATLTVPQIPQSNKSLLPHVGVVTLFGYGVSVRVERGHLIVEDGIGPDRRYGRFPRVGHGLKRLGRKRDPNRNSPKKMYNGR